MRRDECGMRKGRRATSPHLAPGQWPGVHNRRSAAQTTAAEDYEIAPAHRKASKLPLYIGQLGGDRRTPPPAVAVSEKIH
jgi:hypothetical protein